MTTNRTPRITVGVADKQQSLLDYARVEAASRRADIRLVHAYVVPPSSMGSLYGIDIPGAYRSAGEELLAEAAHYLAESGTSSPVHWVLTRGLAPSVLELEARSADELVIGPDDAKPWLWRVLEGSVARRLLEHAECPVVVVPDSWDAHRSRGNVVLMLDSPASAHGPLQYAFAAAARRDVTLKVLHVAPHRPNRPQADELALFELVDSWFSSHAEVHGAYEVASGDVMTETAVAELDAELLVLGRPSQRLVWSFMMDTLVQQVVAHADCPVAVVPPRWH